MMTELVAERAEKCAEGRHLLSYRRPSPDADQHAVGGIIAKEFGGPATLMGSKGTSCKDTDPWFLNSVEFGGCFKEYSARLADVAAAGFHSRFDVHRWRSQASILRHLDTVELVALEKFL